MCKNQWPSWFWLLMVVLPSDPESLWNLHLQSTNR